MLTEMLGKGGTLCQPARSGQIHCPLIIRATSEDVITGHLVQALRSINSYWWLPDLLNTALGEPRFRRQVHRRLRIEPWANQPRYPRELLPWDEGRTQVDICISWENPPTTVFVEAKYGSDLSSDTANSQEQQEYPADQLIRNIRVGLLKAGFLDEPGSLFEMPPRDLVMVLLVPIKGHPLVARYRDAAELVRAIPNANRLSALPRMPFVGELGYADVIHVLRRQSRWLTRAERSIVEATVTYLDYKHATRPHR